MFIINLAYTDYAAIGVTVQHVSMKDRILKTINLIT